MKYSLEDDPGSMSPADSLWSLSPSSLQRQEDVDGRRRSLRDGYRTTMTFLRLMLFAVFCDSAVLSGKKGCGSAPSCVVASCRSFINHPRRRGDLVSWLDILHPAAVYTELGGERGMVVRIFFYRKGSFCLNRA
jgi:hypothetical protein